MNLPGPRGDVVVPWFLTSSERMDLAPIELYQILLIVLPLGVCFGKWRYSLRWTGAAAVCAALSWIYFNLWFGKLDPADNGFTNAFYGLTGWFWLLPPFVLFGMVFRRVERHVSSERRRTLAGWGLHTCGAVTALIVAWNLFGRISEQRALKEARHLLEQRGYQREGREMPAYEDGRWIIRYPDSDFREIGLTRNGRLSWIGG